MPTMVGKSDNVRYNLGAQKLKAKRVGHQSAQGSTRLKN